MSGGTEDGRLEGSLGCLLHIVVDGSARFFIGSMIEAAANEGIYDSTSDRNPLCNDRSNIGALSACFESYLILSSCILHRPFWSSHRSAALAW